MPSHSFECYLSVCDKLASQWVKQDKQVVCFSPMQFFSFRCACWRTEVKSVIWENLSHQYSSTNWTITRTVIFVWLLFLRVFPVLPVARCFHRIPSNITMPNYVHFVTITTRVHDSNTCFCVNYVTKIQHCYAWTVLLWIFNFTCFTVMEIFLENNLNNNVT